MIFDEPTRQRNAAHLPCDDDSVPWAIMVQCECGDRFELLVTDGDVEHADCRKCTRRFSSHVRRTVDVVIEEDRPFGAPDGSKFWVVR